MELTYEQHVELLKLADYLAKVKITSSKKGNELNSLVNDSGNNHFDRKSIYQKEKPTSHLEVRKS